MDQASRAEIPKALGIKLDCSARANDPYVADTAAATASCVDHRATGTCEFADCARTCKKRNPESELSDYASWKLQAKI